MPAAQNIGEKVRESRPGGRVNTEKKYNMDSLRCFGDCTEESQNTQESRGMKAMTALHPKPALQTDEGNSGSRYVNRWNRTSTAHMQELTECNCCTWHSRLRTRQETHDQGQMQKHEKLSRSNCKKPSGGQIISHWRFSIHFEILPPVRVIAEISLAKEKLPHHEACKTAQPPLLCNQLYNQLMILT